VQLKHLEDESSPETSGNVFIKAPNGTLLAECEGFQHNRNYHKRGMLADAMIETVKEKYDAAKAPESPKSPVKEVCEPLVQEADAVEAAKGA